MADRIYVMPLAGGTSTRTEASHSDAIAGSLIMVVVNGATAAEVADVLGLFATDLAANAAQHAGNRNRVVTFTNRTSRVREGVIGYAPRGPFIQLDEIVGPAGVGGVRLATHADASTGETCFVVPFAASAAQLATAVAALRAEVVSNPAKFGS